MLKLGSVVQSKKGHDIKRIYLVLKLDKNFAYLCDGKYRLTSNLKKKRISHLEEIFVSYKLDKELDSLKDFEIATIIKNIMHKD